MKHISDNDVETLKTQII